MSPSPTPESTPSSGTPEDDPEVLINQNVPKSRLDEILSGAIPATPGLTWGTASADDLKTSLLKAIEKMSSGYIEPPAPYVVHPRHYDEACDLLGAPRGSALTNADLDRAASLQIKQLAEEQGVEPIDVLGEIFASLGINPFGY